MKTIVLSPSALSKRIEQLASAYCAVFSAAPWSEKHTPTEAAAHLRSLRSHYNGDVIVTEETTGDTLPAFELGMVLRTGNPILLGLTPFGAREGDYYLSEFVVASDRDAADCDSLLNRLRDVGTLRRCRRIWVRSHPLAERDHQLFCRHGFTHHGSYSHRGRTFMVYSRPLP